MSIQNFIPTVWSDQLLVQVRANLVYANLANRDYEGEIRAMGDTVKINAIGDITISSYVKDTDIASPQALTGAQTMLTLDQAKYFNFAIDDIDSAQQSPKVMGEATSRAGYKVALTIDQFVAGLYTQASANNLVGSSGSFVTPATPLYNVIGGGTVVYDYLVQLNQYLTQSLIPKAGRWMVVPLWVTTHLKMDPRFTGYNTDAGRAAILSGKLDASEGESGDAYIGMIDGTSVYESVNAPHLGGTLGQAGSQDVVLIGHKMALTFADGIVETEAYRPPARFSDALKGLHVYGAKCVRPEALGAAYFQHP